MHKREYALLVEQRREHLYRLAYCYVKNQQDALDIVGEAVYRGLLHLHSLREPERFCAWMDQIVVHAALDRLRKSKPLEPWDEDAASVIPAAEKDLAIEEEIDLYEALDLLSPEERTYIILRFFEEYSFREMGEILGLPESTIKSRMYRILSKLRRQLDTREVRK